MKVVFLSNYFNHHQKPFSEAIYKKIKDDYCFIATEPMDEERKQMGWSETNSPNYVRQSYLNIESQRECALLVVEADIVIIGSAPEKMIKERIRKGKIVFRYSERPLKQGLELLKYPLRLLIWHFRNPFWKPIYMLCASAYTAMDYRKFGLFRDKTYKWGYFPEVKKYDNIEQIIQQKNPISILWVARYIDWKHPEAAIQLAKRLKEDKVNFELNIIGNGGLEKNLRSQIELENLDDLVYMFGPMKPAQVRKYMERAGIFLFTSDFKEGWGAVLNESMNSGCAVVASHAIGSVPYLISHKENGLIYENGNQDDLYQKVKYLLENQEEQKRLGRNAYRTLIDTWNAEVAANRLIELIKQIQEHGFCELYDEGPCSRAEILENDWFCKIHSKE